jgi:hypothetical protein
MKAKYAVRSNQKMVQKLENYQTDTADTSCLRRWFAAPERDTAMHELGGGTMAAMKSVITGIFFPNLRCTDSAHPHLAGKSLCGENTGGL